MKTKFNLPFCGNVLKVNCFKFLVRTTCEYYSNCVLISWDVNVSEVLVSLDGTDESRSVFI